MRIGYNFTLASIVFLLYSNHAFSKYIPVLDNKLFKVHEALFDMFVWLTPEEQGITTKNILDEARAESWKKVGASKELKAALFLMGNIRLLHNQALLQSYYRTVAKEQAPLSRVNKNALKPIRDFTHYLSDKKVLSVADLSIDERLELFSLLLQSEVNILRRIGFYLRLFYLDAVYGSALGERLSGMYDERPKEAHVIPSLPTLSSPLRYDPKNKRFVGQIDILIAGSGAAASVAGAQLQKAGKRVMLVEKGSFVIPGAINTTTNLRFMEQRGLHISEDGSVALLNGETAGGGPTVNIDMSFPPTRPFIRHRFDLWHEQGFIPEDLWTPQQIQNAFSWVFNIFKPRTIEKKEINDNNKVLLRGAKALGIPVKRYELNKHAPGESPHEVYSKKSSLEYLLLQALLDANNPLTLLTNCQVSKVLIKDGHARGLECIYETRDSGLGVVNDFYGFHIKEKTKIRIYADHVVLAAGTLGTSGILLRSAINNPNIGRRFVVHPFMPMIGTFEEEIHANVGEPSTVYIDHFMQTKEHPNRPGFLLEAAAGQANFGAILTAGTPRQVSNSIRNLSRTGGFGVMLIDTPNDYNRIELGLDGSLKVHYRISNEDRARFVIGMKKSVEILFAAGAKEVFFNSFEYPMFQSSKMCSNSLKPNMDLDSIFDEMNFTPSQTFLLAAHMMGGNKLGTSPENSVVDGNYQMWGVEGLYVIDSSIFPTSMGANPMQTIYTCAKIFVDIFLRNYS